MFTSVNFVRKKVTTFILLVSQGITITHFEALRKGFRIHPVRLLYLNNSGIYVTIKTAVAFGLYYHISFPSNNLPSA